MGVVTFVTTDFFMVLQGFVTELMNSKISLFVVIDPIGNCVCAMCPFMHSQEIRYSDPNVPKI